MTQAIEKFVSPAEPVTGGAEWLEQLRTRGVERFNALGIPTTRNEDWKYTDLRALASRQYTQGVNTAAAESPTATSGDTCRVVFRQGELDSATGLPTDLPEGVVLMSMREALQSREAELQALLQSTATEQGNAFAELNIGLFRDGLYLKVAAGVKLDRAIEAVFISEGDQTINLPRNLIVLEDGASVQLVERQLSGDASSALSNSVTEVVLGRDSRLGYDLVQMQGSRSSHIGATWVHQAEGSELKLRTITLGGQLVRNELNVLLNGKGAHADCVGLYYGRRRQHIDNHTTIRHAVPECTSRELYKGILDDRARGVFHGRVVVEQDAQLTVSEQENPNLLLSRDAEVDTKPQLEIYADDVKCSHGATVGELDKKQLFYMQTRGIDMASARVLLTYAFAAEALQEIGVDSLREELENYVAGQMHLEDL